MSGADGLSLRELARAVGVSHGAPRRHFDDKAALLEALAAEGWHRLGDALARAAQPSDADFAATLKRVAVAYVRFGTDNAALTDLMSTSKHLADASDQLRDAREAAFAPVAQLVESGQSTGELADGDIQRIGTVIFCRPARHRHPGQQQDDRPTRGRTDRLRRRRVAERPRAPTELTPQQTIDAVEEGTTRRGLTSGSCTFQGCVSGRSSASAPRCGDRRRAG